MKRSFFERIYGSSSTSKDFDSFDEELDTAALQEQKAVIRKDSINRLRSGSNTGAEQSLSPNTSEDEGQLPIDVHQTASDIVIRAFVAGVRPEELNISIGRDMAEISGSRMEREQISSHDYFARELFWGSFTRSILLPEEVDVEAASASAKDGLLTIILPKLDKARQTKLRVKAG